MSLSQTAASTNQQSAGAIPVEWKDLHNRGASWEIEPELMYEKGMPQCGPVSVRGPTSHSCDRDVYVENLLHREAWLRNEYAFVIKLQQAALKRRQELVATSEALDRKIKGMSDLYRTAVNSLNDGFEAAQR